MIPLKLELTNFLSYRQTVTLDFEPIQLACISGTNGAGKSSLLEAMTWALFGQSRSRSDDDLVNKAAARQGEAAEVIFTFALREVVYRIIRRRKKQGKSLLEFQLARDGGGWSTISETGIRETQAAIEQTLGMNYDTFINVSFFLQGKADTFTTNTPAQRKQILADLLGVDEWNRYKDRITDQRRMAEGHLSLIDSQLREIEQELTEEEERIAALRVYQTEADRIKRELTAQEQLLYQLRRAAEALERQKGEVTRRRTMLERETQRLNEQIQWRNARQAERAAQQALIDRRAAIEQAHAAYETAQSEFDRWQTRADAVRSLELLQRPHELAIERARSRLAQEQQALQLQSQHVDAMLDERATLETTLDASHAGIIQLTERLGALVEEERALQQARDALQALEAERRLQQQEIGQLAKRAEEIAAQQAAQARSAQQHALAEAAVQELTARLEALNADRAELLQMQSERAHLTGDQSAVRAELDKLAERRDRLRDESGSSCPLCGQPLTAEHRQTVIDEITADGTRLKEQFLAGKRRLEELDARQVKIDATLAGAPQIERQLNLKRQEMARSDAQQAEAARAVAGWEASDAPARLAQLTAQLVDEATLKAQRAEVQTRQQALAEKGQVERSLQVAQRTVAQQEARLGEIARAVKAWEAADRARLAAVTAQLAADDFEPEARAALVDLRRQAAEVGYDAAAHDAARSQRLALADAPRDLQALRTAEATVQSLDTVLQDADAQIAAQQITVAETRETLVNDEAQLAALQADAGDLDSVEKSVLKLREEENAAQRRVGGAIQRVAVIDDQRERRKDWLSQRADATRRIQRLQVLEQACGRDGVQALLIEHALPEIEDSANDLLDRLTNGEMRIAFDTQRKLRTRDELRETLDITILDSNGDRPYENYSGGEQFRINFALRLALSQMLARRAGTRLQTLVIDEGFGSQDPQGRQRLVESIRAVQDQFALVLVITHVEELRDAFPVRIEVTKGLDGSQVTVFGGEAQAA